MSIPDRFYRIAKHKLGEMKDWFDKVDEEDLDVQSRRTETRVDARRELNDSLASGNTPNSSQPPTASRPPNSSYPPRNGGNSGTGGTGSNIPMTPPRSGVPAYGQGTPGGATGGSSGTSATNMTPSDPLDYHYRLLGLEPGADLAAVQAAYNRLAARCDPALFPAGSAEEHQARQIRERLDISYKQLRDVLDTTATRFGRLEF